MTATGLLVNKLYSYTDLSAMLYLWLKTIHIISATVLFGTGLGSAFYMFVANRGKNIYDIVFASRLVVLADWCFTTPALIIQLGTGLIMAHMAGFSMVSGWVFGGLCLYFFAGACWLPVVWLQIKMKDMAAQALKQETDLPALYWRYERLWVILGALAFPAVLVIFYLMVIKP